MTWTPPMHMQVKRPLWRPNGPFVVHKPFLWNGVKLSCGDAFDPASLGCPERKTQQLWSQRMINNAGPRLFGTNGMPLAAAQPTEAKP